MEIGLEWIIIITVILILGTVIAFSNFFKIRLNSKKIKKNWKQIKSHIKSHMNG